MLQVRYHLAHALVSSVRTFLCAFHYNVFHTQRNLRHKLPHGRHRILDVPDGNGDCSIAIIRHAPRQHFKHGNTHRIDVTFFVRESSPCLLRRRVVDRPHHIGGNGIARCRLRDAKIRYLYFSLFGDNDILRFDVPMYDMIVMCRLDSHCHLDCDTDGFLGCQPDLFFYIFL